MRTHHEQAVEMGFMFLALTTPIPALRTVARCIVSGQSIDIGRMIQLLRGLDAPEAAETDEAMAWMGMATTDEEMPGMATRSSSTRWPTERRGCRRLFVELMVAHHEGGAHMAEAAADDAEDAGVRALAEAIVGPAGRDRRAGATRRLMVRRSTNRGVRGRGRPLLIGLVAALLAAGRTSPGGRPCQRARRAPAR